MMTSHVAKGVFDVPGHAGPGDLPRPAANCPLTRPSGTLMLDGLGPAPRQIGVRGGAVHGAAPLTESASHGRPGPAGPRRRPAAHSFPTAPSHSPLSAAVLTRQGR